MPVIFPLGDPTPRVRRSSGVDYNLELLRSDRDKWGRSGVWPARAQDTSLHCDRCQHQVIKGQNVRYVEGFAGAVHDGCCPPETWQDKVYPRVYGRRKPPKCSECQMEHAGKPGEDCL